MTEAQRLELESILKAAEARPRPAYNYAAMSAEQFVFVWTYVRIVEIFLAYSVAAGGGRSRGGALSWDKFDEITQLADPPLSKQNILKLAEWHFEAPIFGLFAEALHEEPCIISELSKRLKSCRFAAELVSFQRLPAHQAMPTKR